ncbi:MAG: hypothetical protein ABI861_06400 [Panacibacter sp.]
MLRRTRVQLEFIEQGEMHAAQENLSRNRSNTEIMKYFFLIIIMFLQIVSFAQKKKDNTIVLLDDVTLSKIKTILFQNGYSIENNDSLYINTTPQQVAKTAAIVKFLIARTETAIYIKGLVKPVVDIQFGETKVSNDFSIIYYGGMKGSILKDSWNELQRISLLLSDNIKYIQQ